MSKFGESFVIEKPAVLYVFANIQYSEIKNRPDVTKT